MIGSPARAPVAYAVPSARDWRRSAHVVRESGPTEPPKPRLLDRVRGAIRARHMSRSTEESYVGWIRRYIFFHAKRHPAEMGAPEVTRFLTALAVQGKVAASTQNQALSALLFLYRRVLELDLPWLDGVVRALTPERLPVVLTCDEVRAILQRLEGVPRLMAYLLYGAGLRLLECCRLRVQDVDFAANQIVGRNAKGRKARVTMLPVAIKADLARHLEGVRAAPARPPARRRVGRTADRARPQVPERRPRLGVAVALSRDPLLRRSRHPRAAPAPPPRIGAPARREGRRPARWDRETRHTAHVTPLVRDAPPRGRVRHPHRSRAPRASRHQNDHDLHARAEPGTRRRPEPGGPDAPVRPRRSTAAGPELRWAAQRPGGGAAPTPNRTQEHALTRRSSAAGPADRLTGPAAFGVFGSSAE